MPHLHNLIEPPGLVRHFLDHPPQDFAALDRAAPSFVARFDLLTTVDLPAARYGRGLLRPRTCFVGTTVSEYALFPAEIAPEELVRDLVERAAEYPFVIVKDIPTDAVLVGDEALAYSRRVAQACAAAGFVLVEGQALAYVPIDFADVDEFVARFSHARRRNVRRKLRQRARVDLETLSTGDARFYDDGFLAQLYPLYRSVYDQSEIHFDLLTPEFFRAVLQDGSINGTLFVYRAGGSMIGWNLCFRHGEILHDKYVGFVYPAAREHDLYAVSWFHNLEYALSTGARTYVAGWTDPEIKRQLGARFTLTVHAVFVRNRAVRALLRPLRRWFESDSRWHESHVAGARP
jgi:uncharacterized protein